MTDPAVVEAQAVSYSTRKFENKYDSYRFAIPDSHGKVARPGLIE